MTYAQFVAGFHFSLVPLAWFNCFLFLTGGRSPSRAEETREAADEDETDQSESNVEPPNNQGLGKVGCFLETADHIKLKCLILLKKKTQGTQKLVLQFLQPVPYAVLGQS